MPSTFTGSSGEEAETRDRDGNPTSIWAGLALPLQSVIDSLIILSGSASVFHPMHTFVDMGILVPSKAPEYLRHRGWVVSSWLAVGSSFEVDGRLAPDIPGQG